MEANRKIISLLFILFLFSAHSQDEAFKFKLDYNVPESPAFSILDANPTTIMRGNAAQEAVVNLATNFISGNDVSPGLAIDFNPFFAFGGRLKSISDYRTKYWNRFLANTQFSIATIASENFPDDVLMSGGIRFTLFDSKDPLYDTTLMSDIDNALIAGIPARGPGQPANAGTIIKNSQLTDAYNSARNRYKESSGGSLSVGYAVAARARGGSFKTDSIVGYRHQAWLAGQYDLGKSKISLSTMFMYRYDKDIIEDNSGVITGLGIRKYGEKVIFSGEFVYDEFREEIGFGAYIEAYLIKNIIIFASFGRDDSIEDSDSYAFKPGVKWNLSESKK